jgi:restriction endonuclease S subunit
MFCEHQQLQLIADIIAGVSGLSGSGEIAYDVVQPNHFADTDSIDPPDKQYRNEAVNKKQFLAAGDILVKRLNPSFVYVIENDNRPMIASQNLFVVRPGPNVDPYYLAFLLEQKDIICQAEHVTGSSAAIKAITIKKLGELTVPLVSMDKQKKIGCIWKLARKRKRLLEEYIRESDRLGSMIMTRINAGGKE